MLTSNRRSCLNESASYLKIYSTSAVVKQQLDNGRRHATSAVFLSPLEFSYRMTTKPSFGFHSHEHAEIYYFHGGKCTYLIGDQIFSLAAGDLILMHGLTLHCPKLFEGEDYIRTTVHFNQSYFKNLLEPMGMAEVLTPFSTLSSLLISFKGHDREELEQLFERMERHKRRIDSSSNQRFQLTFMELLAFLYPFCAKPLAQNNEAVSDKEKHVQKVVSYIESRYNEDLNLDALSEQLHLSKFYLSKIFKEVTGVTIFGYLYQRRINQAKIEFTVKRKASVTEVSYRTGFKHPSHFSKVFKQLTGVTPEKYRKEMG